MSKPDYIEVTPPKDGDDPVTVLKWLITVMNKSDKSLMFTSSVLSHCINYGGLTEKQAAGIEKIFTRVLDQYARGVLEFQGGGLAENDAPSNVTRLRISR